MYIRRINIAAIVAACLFGIGFDNVAYSQTVRLNCEAVDRECLVSEQPVPGVRMVRKRNYPTRPAWYLSSNLYTTLAAGRETFNRFNAFDFQVTVGGGPLPHTHRNEWETFFVLEGAVNFTIGVEDKPPYNFITHPVNAGTVVYGPQGPVHGFVNSTGAPARIFSFALPGGLDEFFHNSGVPVTDYYAPIPPITIEEILRTAFWAEQRGDALHVPNTPAPPVPAFTPDHVISSISDSTRPTRIGPFGETRLVLLTPKEVGNITGATAFCGPPPIPGRPGGSVEYSYVTVPPSSNIPADYISPYTEVFFTMSGNLTLRFETPRTPTAAPQTKFVTVEPLTFIQIEAGIPFSIANIRRSSNQGNAETLAISVIAPVCPPSPFFSVNP
jgi:mannose-6-phosphate isomerase-like protein (cupin superfamily)